MTKAVDSQRRQSNRMRAIMRFPAKLCSLAPPYFYITYFEEVVDVATHSALAADDCSLSLVYNKLRHPKTGMYLVELSARRVDHFFGVDLIYLFSTFFNLNHAGTEINFFQTSFSAL
jgi:hypothetical protein